MNQGTSGNYNAVYFFDTYAFIEVFQGSKAYRNYKKSRAITNILNLYELYYNLRKDFSVEVILRMC